MSALLLAFVHEVAHIAGRAPEAAKPGDHQFVAGAKDVQPRRQLAAAVATCSGYVL